MGLADELDKPPARPTLGALADLLERKGISVDDIGAVSKISAWQQGFKDADGEAQTIDLVGIQFSPTWDTGPAWPVVQPAKPVRVAPRRAKRERESDTQVVLCIPDLQVGHVAGEPMHDRRALTLYLELARAIKPTRIVLLGDNLDLASMSKFGGPPTYSAQLQAAIDEYGMFLAELRLIDVLTLIDMLEGNHEARFRRQIEALNREAFGLRKANSLPDSWPEHSIPNYLRLDELDITYHPGYPASAVWLRDDIVAIHGKRTTAEKASKDNTFCTQVFGHSHRLEVKSRTYQGHGGRIVPSLHISCGTGARIDGAVPSFGSATDEHGRPVRSVEDWCQGAVVLSFGTDDVGTVPNVELVPFHNGTAVWRGRKFVA